MESGSGKRIKPYYRISVEDKGSLTKLGQISSDPFLTHIDLTENYLNEINSIIKKFLEQK